VKRREFITLLGGATAWPFATGAQQPTMPMIGYFSGRSSDYEELLLSFFRKGLEEEGFAIGRNIAVEYRFSDGNEDRLPAIAADFVRRPTAIIVASGTPSAIAAKASTSTVPIVFSMGIDPVGQGLVASMNRPGGNATGVAVFTNELGPKRLELLRELVPKAELIAFVVYPDGAASPAQVAAIQAAGQATGQRILVVNAATPSEIDQAFATMVQHKAGAILYSALAARNRLPAMYEWREFVAAGGLVSYSTNRGEAFRQMGVYVGRILKGEKPADLPVVQPTKFELVINLKTAKLVGLTVPHTLLVAADEVIE
jgi:putative ABC transport system substrate-binding protein